MTKSARGPNAPGADCLHPHPERRRERPGHTLLSPVAVDEPRGDARDTQMSGLVQELRQMVEAFRREAGVGVEQQHIARRAREEPDATRD